MPLSVDPFSHQSWDYSNYSNSHSPIFGLGAPPSLLKSLDNLNDSFSSSVVEKGEKTNPSRYKTELCRPFEENGTCKYGDKCQFAHGRSELRSLNRHPKYKTELCRTFHTTGICPYGPRCHFLHAEAFEIEEASSNHASSKSARLPGETFPRLARPSNLNLSLSFNEPEMKHNQFGSSPVNRTFSTGMGASPSPLSPASLSSVSTLSSMSSSSYYIDGSETETHATVDAPTAAFVASAATYTSSPTPFEFLSEGNSTTPYGLSSSRADRFKEPLIKPVSLLEGRRANHKPASGLPLARFPFADVESSHANIDQLSKMIVNELLDRLGKMTRVQPDDVSPLQQQQALIGHIQALLAGGPISGGFGPEGRRDSGQITSKLVASVGQYGEAHDQTKVTSLVHADHKYGPIGGKKRIATLPYLRSGELSVAVSSASPLLSPNQGIILESDESQATQLRLPIFSQLTK